MVAVLRKMIDPRDTPKKDLLSESQAIYIYIRRSTLARVSNVPQQIERNSDVGAIWVI